MKRKIILFILMAILLLTSCTPRSTENGNIDEKKIVDDLNQNDVIAEELHSEMSSKTITETDTDTISGEDKAKELNTIGYELYKTGEYENALDYFSKSINEDNEYLYAHYNYACTLGVLMQQDYPLWYERRDDIYVHLKKTVEINPNYIEKIKNDTDLDCLRKDFRYLQLLGYSISNDDDIEYILQELEWNIQGSGIINSIGGMGFFRDGTFTISFLNLERFSEGDFDFPRDVFTGRYTVTDGMIKFKLDEKMLLRRSRDDFYEGDTYDDVLEFNGYLDESGALIIDLFEYHIDNYVEEFSA